VRTKAGADTLHDRDPRPQTGVIRPPVEFENDVQVLRVVPDGTLAMFPSFLPHATDA
jgi:hypothetical protein